MSMTRRELFAACIPCFLACKVTPTSEGDGETGDELPHYEWDQEPGPDTIFSHGVASGDPLSNSVILWTRLSPPQAQPIESFFEVALDPEFTQRVAADWIPATDEARDYTVKLDVEGLEPATTYYYRFHAQGRVSPIGRTRTAASGPVESLRFALCTCASFGHGHFHPYAEIAARADLDAVVHVGDYIYEYADGVYGDVLTLDPPHELQTLDDYRRRYRLYRTSPALQEAHRQHPFIAAWDDHEIANNSWPDGAENHDEAENGPWADRKAAATQAYFEWLPLREGVPGRVYRELRFGDLAHLIVLDTRFEGREKPVNLNTDPNPYEAIADPDRQLLGAEQEAWMLDQVGSSEATWILLAQQAMVAHFVLQPGQDGAPDRPFKTDSWDGYEAARQRLLGLCRDGGVRKLVVLSGDLHASFANDLIDDLDSYDPDTGAGSLAVEFMCPSVSAAALNFDDATLELLRSFNPHWRFADLTRLGYVTLDIRPERVQADWWHFEGGQLANEEFSPSTHAAAWVVQAGATVLTPVDTPAPDKPEPPPLAP